MVQRQRTKDDRADVPRPDAILAAGLLGILAGVWLLRLDDPFLLTLWGVAFLLLGGVLTVLSVGMLLRLWE